MNGGKIMLNRIVLIGNLSKDIELRYTSTNKAVANSMLAVKRQFKSSNGEYETDFINIVVWGKQGENLKKYCSKGSKIAVDGSLQIRSYQNNNGENRYITEVVCNSVAFLDSKPKQETTQQHYESKNEFGKFGGTVEKDDPFENFNPDSLPF